MDGQVINSTKNVMNAMKTTRGDLKAADAAQDHTKNKIYAQTFVNNLGNLCNDASKQIALLKSLDSGNNKGESGEEGMKVNYYEILTEKMKNELGGIANICAKVLTLQNKKNFGTTSSSEEQNKKLWDNVNKQVKSLGQKIINQGAETDQFVTIAKLMDLKDNLYSQMFTALLYKKTLLYEDLDLNSSVATKGNEIIYTTEKILQMHNKIADFEAIRNHLPQKIDYVPITEETTGCYTSFNEGSNDVGSEMTESSKSLEALTDAIVDMTDLVQKNWLFSEEKIKGFMETNPVQRSLRVQVEQLCIQNAELQKKADDANAQMQKNEEQAQNMAESTAKAARQEEQMLLLTSKNDDLERGQKEVRAKLIEL